MGTEDDFGEVSQFNTPKVTVERYVTEVNTAYGDQVAKIIQPQVIRVGKLAGKQLYEKLNTVGRELSDQYSDILMALVRTALADNLPANVDRSDLEASEDPEGEIWDDVYHDMVATACYDFTETLMPYIATAMSKFADGMDWGMPFPASDYIKEEAIGSAADKYTMPED